MELLVDTDGRHLDAFHKLYVGIYAGKHGFIPHGKRLFRAIFRHFPSGAARVYLAKVKDNSSARCSPSGRTMKYIMAGLRSCPIASITRRISSLEDHPGCRGGRLPLVQHGRSRPRTSRTEPLQTRLGHGGARTAPLLHPRSPQRADAAPLRPPRLDEAGYRQTAGFCRQHVLIAAHSIFL
jgi:hypothetical protein